MNIILPKMVPSVDAREVTPLFFLMGPVKGGRDWQARCCKILKELLPEAWIATPRSYGPEHHLRDDLAAGELMFASQLLWERHYLEQAAGDAKAGCIISWLPVEDTVYPRNDGQPYARDTYGELGEWRGRLMGKPGLRFVLGAEDDFPGLRIISRNFKEAVGQEFHISTTLEDTVQRAVDIAFVKIPDISQGSSS